MSSAENGTGASDATPLGQIGPSDGAHDGAGHTLWYNGNLVTLCRSSPGAAAGASFEASGIERASHPAGGCSAADGVTMGDDSGLDDGWGLIENGAILTSNGHISWVGERQDVPDDMRITSAVDLDGEIVTPALVDCHTHLVYGGHRADEHEQRLGGASYAEIAARGGGIRSTVRATRDASDEELYLRAEERALLLLSEGVTTIEVKSGYGLRMEDELRMLRVARRLGEELPLDVRTTWLAAHALPPEFDDAPDEYIAATCEWLAAAHDEGLVDAVDAFCEHLAFDASQVRRVFEAAAALGLPVKAHAEQLSLQGGAALVSEFRGHSADHLEYLDRAGVKAMAAADTIAVLLPGAFHFLRESQRPPIEALRSHGVRMAIATDHNPGTSPLLSLLLAAHLSCTHFRITPLEAMRAITQHAASALGLDDRGILQAGAKADFVGWSVAHPRELFYWFGQSPIRRIVRRGEELT